MNPADLVCTTALWLPLYHTASQKRVLMKTSLASEFYKTKGWWGELLLRCLPGGVRTNTGKMEPVFNLFCLA